MREIRKLSNSLLDFIVMEEDVPSNHPEKKLPILDLKVWMLEKKRDDGTIYYQVATEFYEKPMVGDLMMMKRSGMPRKMKLASLTQEVIRRNRNQTGDAPSKLRGEHLSRFMLKLKLSGYEERRNPSPMVHDQHNNSGRRGSRPGCGTA